MFKAPFIHFNKNSDFMGRDIPAATPVVTSYLHLALLPTTESTVNCSGFLEATGNLYWKPQKCMYLSLHTLAPSDLS